ncbi:Rpn family recombination-promoting nuclease/putative transposase [Fibrisoma montanum]|uniref:Rpn family recombination-promoting nuclease/putative transposase n=1 Tax=Fibrisoma montanum TaxID=2305895 RepID=UPI001E49A3B8|nr:Rpn family recombination-promoting nuclease/putative transposase [Fibrisoma montanum]
MNDPDALFIPLVSDYGFKVVFGNEKNTIFLRKALQALIQSEVPIREVYFDKNTFDAIVKDSRGGIYDLACIDEQGNHFIVEMQVSDAPYFFQRMKFYAFHKFNSLVQKGNFDYNNLDRIYCIGILANNIFAGPDFHTIAAIRKSDGELIDEQITARRPGYVTVELDKFRLTADEVQTDLEKLVYTMKTIHTTTQPTQFPAFWNEEWLQVAINELDKRKMTPDERFAYERTLAINAEAIRVVNAQIEEAKLETKREAIIKMLRGGKLAIGEIAEYNDVSDSEVERIQRELRLAD